MATNHPAADAEGNAPVADLQVESSAAFNRIRVLDPDQEEALDMLQHLSFLAPSAVLLAADALEARRARDAEHGPPCRVCGCVTSQPCEGGCVWMPDPEQHFGRICSTHFTHARDLVMGQIVRTLEWDNGSPVRIITVHNDGDAKTVVHWQDVNAHRNACVSAVNSGYRVLPVGGGR